MRIQAFFTAFIAVALLALVGCPSHTKGERIAAYASPNKALLVIDVQEEFTGPDGKMPVDPVQAKRLLPTVNSLIEEAERKGVLVVYVKTVFLKSDRIANWFRNQAGIEGSPALDFDRRLVVVNDKVFVKHESDAFSNAEFEKYLVANRVNELYLTGVFADFCVFYTSRGALQRGYKVNFVRDAVAAKTSDDAAKAADKIGKEGAAVIEAERAFE